MLIAPHGPALPPAPAGLDPGLDELLELLELLAWLEPLPDDWLDDPPEPELTCPLAPPDGPPALGPPLKYVLVLSGDVVTMYAW